MQKIILCLCVLFLVPVSIANTVWNPAGNGIRPPATGDWGTAANWTNGLPGGTDPKAVFNVSNAAECVVTNSQTFTDLVQADGGDGGVIRIQNNGNLTTTGGWMSVGYSNEATMIIETGGVLNVGGHMWNGMHDAGIGTIELNGGTINVSENFGLGWYNGAQNGVAYFYVNSGLLSLDHWSYPASIHDGSFIDITDGTITINGDKRSDMAGYITAGKIKGFDGTGEVLYDYNSNTNKTTIWAESLAPKIGNGDINKDSYVDAADLSLLAEQWLNPTADSEADFTRDEKVNMDDFQILAKNWNHNEYSKTLTGKIMCGYQGWFNAPGDGTTRGWVHWGTGGNSFTPGACTIDIWPDMSEYDEDEKFWTPFKYADNSPAYVFSSHNEKTVQRHFSWMAEYGIDGVFLQRFASETTSGSASRNNRDDIMVYCRDAANLHKRAWAMMYDLSSNLTGPQLKQKVIDDWKHLVDTYKITQDPEDSAYLHHNGKPVVAVWGLGFGRDYEGQDTYDIINFLKNDETYGGCTIMIGVQNSWRTNSDTWFKQIVGLADIISPWAVGRFGSKYEVELNNFTNNYTIPDQAWCNNPANNKDYLPVVFPGFSWQNLKGEKWDHIPRRGGAFLWRQMYKAMNDAGVTMIYQAMFDEVDEATAIFKCSSAPPVAEASTGVSTPFLPTGNRDFAPYPYLTSDYPYLGSDADLPSDHYLWLVGEATKMLRGERPLTETMPTR